MHLASCFNVLVSRLISRLISNLILFCQLLRTTFTIKIDSLDNYMFPSLTTF